MLSARYHLPRHLPDAAPARIFPSETTQRYYPKPWLERHATPLPAPHLVLPILTPAWYAGQSRDLSYYLRHRPQTVVRAGSRTQVQGVSPSRLCRRRTQRPRRSFSILHGLPVELPRIPAHLPSFPRWRNQKNLTLLTPSTLFP